MKALTTTTNLLFLQNNLKKFGLNPADWNIEPMREKEFKIAHIRDVGFYFLGEAEFTRGAPLWKSLILASF